VVLFFCLLEHAVPFVILVAADDASTPTNSDPKSMLVTTTALAFFIINHSLCYALLSPPFGGYI
jgi:hypothetical protein